MQRPLARDDVVKPWRRRSNAPRGSTLTSEPVGGQLFSYRASKVLPNDSVLRGHGRDEAWRACGEGVGMEECAYLVLQSDMDHPVHVSLKVRQPHPPRPRRLGIAWRAEATQQQLGGVAWTLDGPWDAAAHFLEIRQIPLCVSVEIQVSHQSAFGDRPAHASCFQGTVARVARPQSASVLVHTFTAARLLHVLQLSTFFYLPPSSRPSPFPIPCIQLGNCHLSLGKYIFRISVLGRLVRRLEKKPSAH